MKGSDDHIAGSGMASSVPDSDAGPKSLVELQSTLEAVLTELDALGLAEPAIHLSHCIELIAQNSR